MSWPELLDQFAYEYGWVPQRVLRLTLHQISKFCAAIRKRNLLKDRDLAVAFRVAQMEPNVYRQYMDDLEALAHRQMEDTPSSDTLGF